MTLRGSSFLLGFVIVMTALFGATGGVQIMGAGAAADQQPREGIDSMPINWDNPIVNAVAVERAEETAAHMGFSPSAPPELGTPQRVLMTAPPSAQRAERVMSLEYRHPKFGRFLAIQAVSQTTEAELVTIAAQCLPERGCEAKASIETLRNGNLALLLQGPTATSITFLRAQVRFDVLGPPGTFTADHAREVANTF